MVNQMTLARNRRGQSMVETALILPIILLILLGILEFGRILSAWMIITHASREGARVSSLGGTTMQVEERVDAVSKTLDLTDITVIIAPSGTLARGDMVTVTVTYNIDLMTPLIGAIVGDTVPMNAETVMRLE